MSEDVYLHEHVTSLSPTRRDELKNFITRPDTRQNDVFIEQNFAVGPQLDLNWIVKHDIFEGVIMHISLIDTELYRHLAGIDKMISEEDDILGEYIIRNQSNTYRLVITLQQSP